MLRCFNIENRTIETNTKMNNYNGKTTNADKDCSAASKTTIVIMILIAVTIEKILSETCIKYLMRYY